MTRQTRITCDFCDTLDQAAIAVVIATRVQSGLETVQREGDICPDCLNELKLWKRQRPRARP